ncbi:hypothetical protein QTP88_029534 [Uroleucon formosanum]
MSSAKDGDTPTDVVVNTTIEAIANVRLPAFWKQSPQLWFTHVESVFANQRVASNAGKVNFVVGALDEEGEPFLYEPSVIYSAPEPRMGDRRPSQLLRDMHNNMPSGISEDALKEFWLQKLPSNVTAIISSLDGPLDSLAARADRVLDASNPQSVDAFAKDQFTELVGTVAALTQQVQSLTQMVNSPKGPTQQRAQVITAQACGISHRTVKRICAEARKSDDPETPDASPTFISPRKGYKRAKTVSELDDFDSDIVRRTVYEFYDRGEYPTAQLILSAVRKKNKLYRVRSIDAKAP